MEDRLHQQELIFARYVQRQTARSLQVRHSGLIIRAALTEFLRTQLSNPVTVNPYSELDEQSVLIRELISNNIIKIKPKGYSMYPLFVPGRDYAVISVTDTDSLKRGDVVLYRRFDESGILVLHRICKIRAGGFYMVGDNQSEVEGPIGPEQIRGKLTAIERKGKSFSVKNPVYRALSGIWLFLLPVRGPVSKAAVSIKRFFKKLG